MAATRTFQAATSSTADASSYTFSAAAIGTAATDRKVVVGVYAPSGTASTFDSATIAEVSATILTSNGSSGNEAGFFIASVPTGTTGDIVVNFSAAKARCTIGVWATYGMLAATTSVDSADTTDPFSAVVNVPAGGAAFAIVGIGADDAFGWTNLTEDFDITVESTRHSSGASDEFGGAATALTITADAVSSGATGRMAVVTFGPVVSFVPPPPSFQHMLVR